MISRRILSTVAALALVWFPPATRAGEIHWSNPGGGLWSDAANWSPQQVPAAADQVVIDLPGAYTITLRGSRTCASLAVVNPTATLLIEGTSGDGNARLGLVGGGTNQGVIRLVSSSGNRNCTIDNDGPAFINAGLIQAEPAGGGRFWEGHLRNEGQIVAASGATLDLSNGTLDQDAGALRAESAAKLRVQSGRLNLNGGAIVHANDVFCGVYVSGAELYIDAGMTTAGTVFVEGDGTSGSDLTSTLIANLSPSMTVWLDGGSDGGNGGAAHLNVAAGALNSGTIHLQARGNYGCCGYVYDTRVYSLGVFTNEGTISSAAGVGGVRELHGDLANEGQIIVQSGAFDTWDSTLDNTGLIEAKAGAKFRAQSGRLNVLGGGIVHADDVFCGVYVSGADLYVDPAVNSASTIFVEGDGVSGSDLTSTLIANLSPSMTVWLDGGSDGGNGGAAHLNVAAGALNSGTIHLQARGNYGCCGYVYDTRVYSLGVFTNEGTISSAAGVGGVRELHGDLANEGQIIVQSGAFDTWDSTLDNTGLIEAKAGAKFRAQTGRLNLLGGSLAHANDVFCGVYASGVELYVAASATTPFTLFVEGDGTSGNDLTTTLLANLSPAVTIWLDGGSDGGNGGDAHLAMSPGAVNRGTIVLQSRANYGCCGYSYDTRLLAPSGFINRGTIVVEKGTAGVREFHGMCDNRGVFDLRYRTQIRLFDNFSQNSAGLIKLYALSGSDFSRAQVAGPATLGGGIHMQLLFSPPIGTSFDALCALALTDFVERVTGSYLSDGVCLQSEAVQNCLRVTLSDEGCPPVCAADADEDGLVGQSDLGIVLAYYLQPVWPCENGDANCDCLIDQADLGILLAHYGESCP